MVSWLSRFLVVIFLLFGKMSFAAWYDDGNYPTNQTAVCENLGASCKASELLSGAESVHSGGTWIKDADTMVKRCVTASSIDPYTMYRDIYFEQETAPTNPSFSLPINHTYVWSRLQPSATAYMLCAKSANDAVSVDGVTRLCLSKYIRINQDAVNSSCQGGRRYYVQWGSAGAYHYLDSSANSTRISTYKFDQNEDGTHDGFVYINGTVYGGFDYYTDCLSSWCRLEVCMEAPTSTDLASGNNISIEGILEKIGGASSTARIEYAKTYMGDSDPANPASSFGEFRSVDFYTTASCSATARTYFANITMAGWTTNNGQKIGPTPEIGRGYTGYCDVNGLNCTGGAGGGSPPNKIRLPKGILLSKLISMWDMVYVSY